MRAYVRFLQLLGVGTALLCLSGCATNEFAEQVGRANGLPVDLQSEQVTVSFGQVACGVDNDLFFAPENTGTRTIARVTEKGRNLGFSDDVTMDEPGFTLPYTQVRGKFPVEFGEILNVKDVELGVKRVEIRAGIRIPHECFGAPLPLMGIHKGVIAQNIPPAFEFDEYGHDWRLEGILH